MAGNSLPSIHSKKAPPAVEIYVNSLSEPVELNAEIVSHPPATLINFPSRVNFDENLAISSVELLKG